MLKNFLKKAFISLLILIMIPSYVFAVSGKVTGTNVRIREKASSKSPEVSVATKGEKVDVIGEEDNWYQVKFENVTGYISKDYVDTDYKSTTSNFNEISTENEGNSNSDNELKVENETNTNTETPKDNTDVSVNSNNSDSSKTLVEDSSQISSTETDSDNINEKQSQTIKVEENQEVIFDHDVNLKYLPNFSSRDSALITSGSTYLIKACLNNWAKVSNDTNSGWVLLKDIPITDTTNAEDTENVSNIVNNETSSTDVSLNKKGKVNVDSARIRKKPDGEVLDSLSKGTEVIILSEENDWYKISTSDYNSCYIAKRLITEL